MARHRGVLHDFGLVAWGEGGSRLLGMCAGIVIARSLGPSDYGLLSFAATWLTYALLVVVFGSSDLGITMLASESKSDDGRLTRSILRFRVCVAIVAYPIFVLVVGGLPQLQEMRTMVAVLGVWIFAQAATTDWWLTGTRQFGKISQASILSGVVYLGTTLGSAVLGAGVVGMAIASVSKPISQSIVQGLGGGWGAAYQATAGIENMRKLVKTRMVPLGVTSLITQVYFTADVLIVGFLCNPSELGMYSAAVRVIALGLSIRIVFGSVIYPKVAAAASRATVGDVTLLASLNRWALTAGLAIGIVGTLASGAIVHLLYGQAFQGAVIPLGVGWWVVGLDVAGTCLPNILAARRPVAYLRSVSIAAVVSVLGNFVVVQQWGIRGASIVYVTAGVVLFGLLLFEAGHALDSVTFAPSFTHLAFAVICCTTMIGVLLLFGHSLPLYIVGAVMLGVLGVLRRSDLGEMWRIVRAGSSRSLEQA